MDYQILGVQRILLWINETGEFIFKDDISFNLYLYITKYQLLMQVFILSFWVKLTLIIKDKEQLPVPYFWF